MEVVENQKVIVVCKENADKDHPYSIINLSALDKALGTLKNSEFKLWIYIAKNQNNYTFALSCADFCRTTGVSNKTYHSAVKSLIEKGYLVKKNIDNDKDNTYTFHEAGFNVPMKEDIVIEIEEAKRKQQEQFVF